jgi:hypothetical protein
MFPNTQSFIQRLMAEEEPEGSRVAMGAVEDPAMHDPKILQMQIKRKHQLGMIRKMLEESGYGDLAKMTTLSKRDYDENID